MQKCAKFVDPPKSCNLSIYDENLVGKSGLDTAETEPSAVSRKLKNFEEVGVLNDRVREHLARLFKADPTSFSTVLPNVFVRILSFFLSPLGCAKMIVG